MIRLQESLNQPPLRHAEDASKHTAFAFQHVARFDRAVTPVSLSDRRHGQQGNADGGVGEVIFYGGSAGSFKVVLHFAKADARFSCCSLLLRHDI